MPLLGRGEGGVAGEGSVNLTTTRSVLLGSSIVPEEPFCVLSHIESSYIGSLRLVPRRPRPPAENV